MVERNLRFVNRCSWEFPSGQGKIPVFSEKPGVRRVLGQVIQIVLNLDNGEHFLS